MYDDAILQENSNKNDRWFLNRDNGIQREEDVFKIVKANKWKTARQLFYIQQISFITPRAMNMSQKNNCGRIPVMLEVLKDAPQAEGQWSRVKHRGGLGIPRKTLIPGLLAWLWHGCGHDKVAWHAWKRVAMFPLVHVWFILRKQIYLELKSGIFLTSIYLAISSLDNLSLPQKVSVIPEMLE